ncbi:haloalkane dehalogenase [Aliiglaciecola sp. LCG003]|uniref:haloalkane dehalogenase n=1 Tax=Aliiglaciecola sp. LCG003 TaxID=3053655 RepID=UPI00257377A9|nr:haloalkane dehalogenase [Aliiglaciecola sp. LCG003]WJG10742.1 haloalkane dehalogenase [Aliiglaciecola sp. LCG003]
MEFLRTPETRFECLTDFPFSPHYLDIDDTEQGSLRMHYVDEGDKSSAVVLLLHGEPSWSYLYRKMITPLTEAGYRVIAPDLIGFGRSDKPTRQQDYTYQRHLLWLQNILTQLDLNQITLVCQDWGGLLGLRLVVENPQRFARICVANTFLPTGDEPLGAAFEKWQTFSQTVEELPIGGIIKGGTTTELSPQVLAGYDAPFPDERYKAGARAFPNLVPATADSPESEANRQAWKTLAQWQKPFLTAFSDSDPVTQAADKIFQQRIPGCAGQEHVTVVNGGHFLQEDQGPRLAQIVVQFIQNNP